MIVVEGELGVVYSFIMSFVNYYCKDMINGICRFDLWNLGIFLDCYFKILNIIFF